jgi:plastocyanin
LNPGAGRTVFLAMGFRARLLALVTALVAVTGFVLAAANALADDVISSATTCASATSCSYSSSRFTISGGQVAQFHNGTAGGGIYAIGHNVTANGAFRGRPLFESATVESGQSGAVKGTQYLPPGDYTFFCTIHGPTMSAKLHVVGGAPLARPKVDLTIESAKLAKVRRSGKLQVRATGSGSQARGVALKARIGRSVIARKSDVAIAAGADRLVGMKLSKAGLRALKGRHTATVAIAATVPFGAAAKAKRTLR